jgi:acetyl esterase/lipase
MKRINLILILILACSSFSCSREDATVNYTDLKTAELLTNVSYGEDDRQVFDIYLPANRSAKSTKTLVLIHGGAWIEGDKSDMLALMKVLQDKLPDYAIVNMNYRLATIDNPALPMQINDISTIINTLKVKNYGISNEFGLIGASAGGHLALLYTYALKNKEIKMVCSLVGPTNLADDNYTEDQKFSTLFRIVTGVPYKNNENYYKQLSPLYQVTNQAPPTLLFYGNQDPLVPIRQAFELNSKLDTLQVYQEKYIYNTGHGNWSNSDLDHINKKLVTFINQKF